MIHNCKDQRTRRFFESTGNLKVIFFFFFFFFFFCGGGGGGGGVFFLCLFLAQNITDKCLPILAYISWVLHISLA